MVHERSKTLKFTHIHPLVTKSVSGLGASLECSSIIEVLEESEMCVHFTILYKVLKIGYTKVLSGLPSPIGNSS